MIKNFDFASYEDPGILEFKDVVIGERIPKLSMVACTGKVSTIIIDPVHGHQLMMAILGLGKTKSGYITIDGELVTFGSGSFFRQMMCYVPHTLPQIEMTVKDLCQQAFHQANGKTLSLENLTTAWKELEIDPAIWKKDIRKVSQDDLWLIMLSLVPMFMGPIVLIEEPVVKTETVYSFISQLAQQGKEVICTTQSHPFPSYQAVDLTANQFSETSKNE